MTDPVREALEAAARRATASGYTVPEQAVRSRVRRRRAARVTATGALSLALLTGAGIAVATLDPAEPTPPAVTTTAPLGGHPACGLLAERDGSGLVSPDTAAGLDVALAVEGGTTELVVPLGESPDLTVALHHRAPGERRVTNPEGPVLLALDEESGVVVGYSRTDTPATAELIGPDAAVTYARYGAVIACPGAPAVDDVLAYGTYDAVLAQSLGAHGDAFDVVHGDLELVVAPTPGTARAGDCRSSLDRLPEGSGHHASFDPLEPALAIVGDPFDPGVTMTNRGPRDLDDVIQGGPVLLVADAENTIVARSEPIDPLPGPALAPDESLAFGLFAPLVDCETGEPLAPGTYRYAVAQQARDPESTRPFGMSARFGDLVVTDVPGAARSQVELPSFPACGEPIDGFTFDSGFPAGTVTFAGFASWDHEDTTLQEDRVEGRPTVEYEFTYDGPAREHTFLTRGSVLARDGVVVAIEEAGGWGGAQPATWEPGSTHRATLGSGFDCTADPEDYVELEAEGRYTVIGFTAYDYVDEWGLTNNTVITLGPVEVDFGQR